MADRLAILLDGEFVRKILRRRLQAFPTAVDVLAEATRIATAPELARLELYRVYYYTAEPLGGMATHPLTRATLHFGRTITHRENRRFLEALEQQPNVAIRRGVLVHQGWELGAAAVAALVSGRKTTVDAGDVQPRIQQKGVDMRIGLDIASLALKRLVSTIAVVTGDSDLVPAMKLARREGLRVYLDTLGSPHVRPELKSHADVVLTV